MDRKWKIAIGVGIILVGLLCIFGASFHWTNEQMSIEGSYSRSTSGQVMPWFCRRIAIVGPESKGVNRHLQAAVIRHLQKRLSSEKLLRENFQREGNITSHENNPPSVITYSSVREAVKGAPDLILIIKPTIWQYGLFPLSRSWKARVEVAGKQPANIGHREHEACADNTLEMECKIDLQGKTTGIFTTSYLTSKVGESAAEDIAKYIAETTDSLTKEYEEKMSESGSENDE